MATKSILKSITIKDKKTGRSFVSALENAQNKTSKDVQISKSCVTVTGSDIKKFFEVN